jgi:hypothetical protein
VCAAREEEQAHRFFADRQANGCLLCPSSPGTFLLLSRRVLAAAMPAHGVNTFDTGHQDMIHDTQLDYYGRVRAALRVARSCARRRGRSQAGARFCAAVAPPRSGWRRAPRTAW